MAKSEPNADCGPLRRCIVTGDIGERVRLLRFVVGPTGELVPDIDARLPGRGLWLTPRRDIVERAIVKRLFGRAARRPIVTPPELADRIEALLARRCGDALGLARRAGLAVAGFDRVSAAARQGEVALLLFALDGAEGGRRRFDAIGRDVPAATTLYGHELGAAFGRDRVVYVSVGPGSLSRRLLLDSERLAGFREGAIIDRDQDFAPVQPEQQDGGIGSND